MVARDRPLRIVTGPRINGAIDLAWQNQGPIGTACQDKAYCDQGRHEDAPQRCPEAAGMVHHPEMPWPLTARAIQLRTLRNTEIIMSDLTKLNAAVTSLQAEVGDIGTRMDKLVADLNAAHASGDQAAIDAATTAINDQVTALKAIADRDAPATTPAPAA